MDHLDSFSGSISHDFRSRDFPDLTPNSPILVNIRDYQKTRIERMCERLGIISYTPLWHQSGLNHISGLVKHGFGVMITSVACDGLTEEWIGKILDEDSLELIIQLSERYRFNVDGEGGEYETLVVYGPHFDGKIVVNGSTKWHGRRGELQISNISS